MIMKENIVMFPTVSDKKQLLYISEDYGKSFSENVITFPETMNIPIDMVERIKIDLRNVDIETNSIKLSWYVNSSWISDVIELGDGSCTYDGKVSVENENASLANVMAYASGEEEYFFPDSDSRFIDKNEINNYAFLNALNNYANYLSYWEALNLIINEIYAKMGYDYTGTDYEEYFTNTSWYNQIPKKQLRKRI